MINLNLKFQLKISKTIKCHTIEVKKEYKLKIEIFL